MTELEGPRELRELAEASHKFVKGYMTRKCIHEPPMVFLTKQGIVIPDPKDLENAPRVFQHFLEQAGECYAKTFIARLRNEDGGFSNILGAESDFNYAPAGIMLMDILGLRGEMDVSLTCEYLLQYWDSESGCDVNGDLLFTQRIA